MSEIPNQKNYSYVQILKSTTLVGGAQVINILIGIVRTKFMAMLLGPAGVGLMGMYIAITGMMGSITGLGIGNSGVRQIAEAAGTGNDIRIARTITTLRRLALILGICGMLLTIALSGPLSWMTFGDMRHAGAIAVLSVILFLGAITSGQKALVQGMRRIADLAMMSVLGAFLGTICSIPIIYVWRESGIIPSLVTVAITAILSAWWYARKIPVAKVPSGLSEIWKEARGLLSLGLVFMMTGVISAAVIYMTRVLVVRKLGMDSVGLYQAATTLSSLYIGVILGAMGMDFYPRLTAVAEDNVACNRFVNEQTEVGLLLATPGILITLTFAPYVIQIFYSVKFVPAYEILRWQLLGIFLRVVSWPIGFVLLAKGRGKVFFWTELTANVIHVALIWIGLSLFGLVGTGIAFFLLYVAYTCLISKVVHRISGFSWTTVNLRLIVITAFGVSLAFLFPRCMTQLIALVCGFLLVLLSIFYSLHSLYRLVGPEWISDFRVRLKSRLEWIKKG